MKLWAIFTKALLLFIFLGWQSFAQTTQEKLSDLHRMELDSLFSSWNREHAPGGVVAILSKGKVIYEKPFGMADASRKIKNTPKTQFYIASVAKQFTGMGIALLEEEGKLSVEDDLLKYYPEFKFQEKAIIFKEQIICNTFPIHRSLRSQ